MKTDLEERLKLEAQIQAQEARSHRATVREIYQAITGRTGEPGDWNGAKPVLALIEERDRLRARVDALTGLLSQRDDLIQDNRERIQELKSRMAELEAELKSIADAKYTTWDDGYNTPQDFVAWVQNRCRFLLKR